MMVEVDDNQRYWARPVNINTFTYSKISAALRKGLPQGPVVCFFCKEYLPRVPDHMKEEIKSKHNRTCRHMKILSLVRRNSICIDDSSKNVHLLCRICDGNLDDTEDVEEHVWAPRHKSLLAQLEAVCHCETSYLSALYVVSITKFKECTSDYAFCKLCNIEVECTAQAILMHTSEISHRKLFLEALLPYTGVFAVENSTAMWCKICDLVMDSSEDVLMHITGNIEHGQWFFGVQLRTLNDISILKYLADVNESKVLCTRCDLELLPDFRNITAHVHSEPHRLRRKHSSFKKVKSLAHYGFWPKWCNWRYLSFFRYDASEELVTRFNRYIHTL